MVKDDHVFIRKSISLEQSFDIAFLSLISGAIFSRLLYQLFTYQYGDNILTSIVDFSTNGFSVTGAIIGGAIMIYLLCNYKKVPFGRFSDFISFAFLYSLPLGIIGKALFTPVEGLLVLGLQAILFIVVIVIFSQTVYPQFLSRSIKEGSVSLLFLISYSVISMIAIVFTSIQQKFIFINIEFITLTIAFLVSSFFYIKQERLFMKKKRTLRI